MLTKWEFCRATGKIYESEKDVILDNLLDQILAEPTTEGENMSTVREQHCTLQRQELMLETRKLFRLFCLILDNALSDGARNPLFWAIE